MWLTFYFNRFISFARMMPIGSVFVMIMVECLKMLIKLKTKKKTKKNWLSEEAENSKFFFFVPCNFRTWATVSLHNLLFLAAFNVSTFAKPSNMLFQNPLTYTDQLGGGPAFSCFFVRALIPHCVSETSADSFSCPFYLIFP